MYKQDRKAADDAGLNKNAPLPVPNWLWRERALYTLAPPDDESNWDPTPEQLQSPAVCDDLHVPTSNRGLNYRLSREPRCWQAGIC